MNQIEHERRLKKTLGVRFKYFQAFKNECVLEVCERGKIKGHNPEDYNLVFEKIEYMKPEDVLDRNIKVCQMVDMLIDLYKK